MKTYCISDIHGHYQNFLAFYETLEEDDLVYVLGDVIDKGEDPISCLRLIMNDRRFIMILGNHEYMMWQYLHSLKNDLSDKEENYIQWIEWNRGSDTYKPYLQLEEAEQKKIYDFIEDLPLNVPEVTVNDRKFYLVHSLPGSDKEIRMADIGYNDDLIYSYVWDRQLIDEYLKPFEDKTVIAGHTVVQEYYGYFKCEPYYYGDDISKAPYIDIDGGLAYQLPGSRLIALCLDDLTYRMY
ncbi:MAG: metallophosphoesterase [Erysipelotrichaceae bacterium]|nr:metallophosphoesterase [Erysipelotrichaceae bacterium]